MIKGIFRSISHQHFFIEYNGATTMQDVFQYKVPFWIIGKIFDAFVLKKHLTELLLQRNKTIKEYAESGKWKELLSIA
jgi:ligand-binding SRPBCC domain-containing protein